MTSGAETTRPLGIAAQARRRPDKAALVAGDRRVSYAELDEGANRAARVLKHLGVRPRDCIAIALRNRPEFFEAAAGAARLDADVVTAGWRLKADELSYLVEDSGAKAIIGEPDARETLDSLGAPALYLGGEYEAAVAAESGEPLPGADEPAPVRFRYYTSGTTGRPKAVERPRTSTEQYVQAMLGYPPVAGLTGEAEVHLVCGPLYHTAPCAFANYALLLGHTIVLLERFDAEACLAAIDRERVTWSHMVPINFIRILSLPEMIRSRFDVSSIRKIIHAAAPCPAGVKRGIMDVFPPGTIWEYYGMTEGFATMISPDEWIDKPGSVGRPMPGVHLVVLDEGGGELPAGETGLVYLSSPRGRFSYAGDAEKTAEAWRGDLFTVGDMGYLDADGYLFLTDRKQDIIITGGANVYPAEVESVLHAHPAVVDAAVVGVPDEEWGEAVHAIVETRAAATPEELIAFCRSRLAHYKCPRTVEMTAWMPRDENGKIRKRELRDRYWAGRERKI